ncbi:ABZJ_00895 family protein [uncultured Roseobacter sp.]|uniref:ABZJ_00895 family protein n=1 Tax=uncultured Roseobacter sp. TaxID=114847 RepID=UPI002603AF25|nr:ABZJ_00895 family protein [uncultured Roseobacter sp.]
MFRPIRFCLTMFLSLVATAAIAQLLFVSTGLSVSLAPAPFACLVFAALLEGQSFAKGNKKRPQRDAIWLAALSMTAMAVLILDAIYAFFRIFSPAHVAALGQIEPMNFAVALIALAIVACIAVRFSYETGLKLVLDRHTP